MGYVAVDKDGGERVYDDNPERDMYYKIWISGQSVELPKGSIEKLIGRTLTWEDEPVELKKE